MAKQNSTKEENTGWERRGDKGTISSCKMPGDSKQKNDSSSKDRSITGAEVSRAGLSMLLSMWLSLVTYSATPPMGWHGI